MLSEKVYAAVAMGPVRILSLLAAGLLSIATAAAAAAAPVTASAPPSATVRLGSPVTMAWLTDLDFAALSVTSSGTAIINPNTDALTTTGGVQRVAGTPSAAHFEIAASRAALILIRLPNAPATLTRVGGTETMTVSNWALDGFWLRIVPANGRLDIAVGGRLNISAGQPDGVYVGQFSVNVDYF
jgi:hypothetical protein